MDRPLMLKPRERNYFCYFKTKIYERCTNLFSENYVHWWASIQGTLSGPKQVSPEWRLGWGLFIINQNI